MEHATLTISSKNYASWSMRAWLMCRMAGLAVKEELMSIDDPDNRAELLLLSPSVRVPRLTHDGISVWNTMAIGAYLEEVFPKAGLLPKEKIARNHCRAICGEFHSGFYNLRSAMPMNLKAHYPGFKVFTGARPDVERVQEIWRECTESYGGPFLFGALSMADAVFAPVCTRFVTYDVPLPAPAAAYCDHIMAWPLLREWIDAALAEPEEIGELDVEF